MSVNELEARRKTEEGIRLFQERELEAAIEALTEAIGLDPGYSVAYHWRGMAYQRLGREQSAQDDFAKESSIRRRIRSASKTTDTTANWRRFRIGPTGNSKAFVFTLAATAIPIVGLSLASMARIYPLWFAAAILWGLAIVVAIGAALVRQGDVTAGALAGFAVGMISLGATCFANLATAQW